MPKRLYILVAVVFGISACAMESAPPLGSGLPANIQQAELVFDQRLKQRFPVGSDENILLAELNKEGFTISQLGDHQFGAIYTVTGFPCRSDWSVQWTVDAEKIALIHGIYGLTCT